VFDATTGFGDDRLEIFEAESCGARGSSWVSTGSMRDKSYATTGSPR